MERYIGMDVHAVSCTLGVLDAKGKRPRRDVVATNGRALLEYFRSLPGTLHLCLEESEWAPWRWEILSPHVAEMVVVRGERKKGSKSDAVDARGLAERLRQLAAALRGPVEMLGEQLESLAELKSRAESAMVEESRRHRISRLLETVPGLGPVRVAQLPPIVVTPPRFRTKRQFWSYSGFGVVTRSSGDWVRVDGQWTRGRVAQPRGLNVNYNRTLKMIFKGAATTVIAHGGANPFREAYERLCEQGTKPNLAKLTVARKIAATVLAMWKNEEVYDPTRRGVPI